MIKNIGAIALGFLTLILVSCNEGLANEDMEYDVEIIDNAHILSPKTCNYLRDLRVPNGLIPMIVTVDHIDSLKVAVYAEELMDSIADNYVDGYSFRKRGILLVVSKDPKLIQVRVGNMFSLYTRMRGITAGNNYLKMQQLIAENGIDIMTVTFLQNTIDGIEGFHSLPWLAKRLYFVSQMWDWLEWLEDLSTPSDSFFSKYYFQPVLFLINFLYSIFKNWVVTFSIIFICYFTLKKHLSIKISYIFTLLYKKLKSLWEHESLEEKIEGEKAIQNILNLLYAILKGIITFPTITAIIFLSSCRLEDIITLESAHIPYVSIAGSRFFNGSIQPPIWLLFIMFFLYYFKTILCDKNILLAAFYKKGQELNQYSNDDKASISADLDRFFHIKPSIINPLCFIYISAASEIFLKRPFCAIFTNISRRAYVRSSFILLFSSIFLPIIFVLYFVTLWIIEILFKSKTIFLIFFLVMAGKDFDVIDFFRVEWKRYLLPTFLCMLIMGLYRFTGNPPIVANVDNIKTLNYVPISIEGSYYIVEKDGEKVTGWTADIQEVDSTHYYLYIYSDYPIQRYELEYCPSEYIINSEFLGTGIIEYKKEISKTIIKFSNKWVLEK